MSVVEIPRPDEFDIHEQRHQAIVMALLGSEPNGRHDISPVRTLLMPLTTGEAIKPPVFPRSDAYYHALTNETDNPELAHEAWRIHAEGYEAMGFVHESAVTPEGYLTQDIDKARGPQVDIYLALNPDKHGDGGAMRKVNLLPFETYRDLPAYKLCKEHLSPEGRALLDEAEDNGMGIKEIGALARSKNSHPIAAHELFREAIHDAIGKDEAWLFSIVSTTCESLEKSFGKNNFISIGTDTPIIDSRVKEGIVLRPILLYPDTFIDNILTSFEEASGPASKTRLLRSFMFFTEGLRKDQLSDRAYKARLQLASGIHMMGQA